MDYAFDPYATPHTGTHGTPYTGTPYTGTHSTPRTAVQRYDCFDEFDKAQHGWATHHSESEYSQASDTNQPSEPSTHYEKYESPRPCPRVNLFPAPLHVPPPPALPPAARLRLNDDQPPQKQAQAQAQPRPPTHTRQPSHGRRLSRLTLASRAESLATASDAFLASVCFLRVCAACLAGVVIGVGVALVVLVPESLKTNPTTAGRLLPAWVAIVAAAMHLLWQLLQLGALAIGAVGMNGMDGRAGNAKNAGASPWRRWVALGGEGFLAAIAIGVSIAAGLSTATLGAIASSVGACYLLACVLLALTALTSLAVLAVSVAEAGRLIDAHRRDSSASSVVEIIR